MVITREGIIRYWLSEPARHYKPGYFNLSELPFPDLNELSREEREALRPVLQRHPEYLLEIRCSKVVN